jgi:hypothetical protein
MASFNVIIYRKTEQFLTWARLRPPTERGRGKRHGGPVTEGGVLRGRPTEWVEVVGNWPAEANSCLMELPLLAVEKTVGPVDVL